MSYTKGSQLRATFNDTKKAQESLRVCLDKLEEKNEYVKDRKTFFALLANSLLGLDFEKSCTIFLPNKSVMRVNRLGRFIRELAYVENDMDLMFLNDKYHKLSSEVFNISDVWHGLKFEVFGIFPEALAMSIRISKEQTRLGASEAAEV